MVPRDLETVGTQDILVQSGMEKVVDSTVNQYRPLMTPLISAAREIERSFTGTTKIRSYVSLRGGSSMTRLGLLAGDIDVSLRLHISTKRMLKSEDQSHSFLIKTLNKYLGRLIKKISTNNAYPRGYLNVSDRRYYWDQKNIGNVDSDRYRAQGYSPLADLNLSTINAYVATVIVILSTSHYMRYMDIPVHICTLESRDAVVTMQNIMGYAFGHVFFDKSSAYIAVRSDRIVREQLIDTATPNDYLTLLKKERDHFAGIGEHVTALRRCALVAAYTGNDATLSELQALFSNPEINGLHLVNRMKNIGRLLHNGLVPLSEVIGARDNICLDILRHADNLKLSGIHNRSHGLYRLVEKIQSLSLNTDSDWTRLFSITQKALAEKEELIRNTLRNTDSGDLQRVSDILTRSTSNVHIPK